MSKLVTIACPNCETRYQIGSLSANREITCQRCKKRFSTRDHQDSQGPAKEAKTANVFDSLDIEELLTSVSPGEPSNKKSKRSKSASRPNGGLAANRKSAVDPIRNDSASPKQSKQPKQSKKRQKRSKDQQRRPKQPGHSPERDVPTDRHPDPALIQSEIDIVVAAQQASNRSKNSDEDKPSTTDPQVRPQASSLAAQDEIDDEEIAIYRAVNRQNRRRNIFWGALAAITVLLIGGYFAASEYQRLTIPMTKAEREWLTDRGFVLKIANDPGGPRRKLKAKVIVAKGKSFSDVDQFPVAPNDATKDATRLADGLLATGPANRSPEGTLVPGGRRASRRRRPLDPPSKARVAVDVDTMVEPEQLKIKPIQHFQSLTSVNESAAAMTVVPAARGGFYWMADDTIQGFDADGLVLQRRTVNLPSGRVTAAVATLDGRRLIVGGESGLIHSYRLDAKGRLTDEFRLRNVHRDKIIALKASEDSKTLVVYSSDGRMTIWGLDDQEIQLNLSDLVPEPRLQGLRLTASAVLISSREGIRTIPLHQPSVKYESFDKRYRLLKADETGEQAVFIDGARLGVIDVRSKQKLWDRSARIAGFPRVELSPDRATAFYFDGGRDILQFNLSDGRIVNRFGGSGLDGVSQLRVSVDGQRLIVLGNNNQIYLYAMSVANQIVRPELKPPLPLKSRRYPPAFEPSGDDVVQVSQVAVPASRVTAVCFKRNGYLVVADSAGRLIVFDWIREQVVDEKFDEGRDEITCLETIGERLLVGRSSGAIDVFEFEDGGKLSMSRPVGGQLDPIQFFGGIAETDHVYSIADTGHTRVWDLETGDGIYDGRPMKGRILGVAVDRRSDILFADGKELVSLDYVTTAVKRKMGNRRFTHVALSPDGKRLAFVDRGNLNIATTRRGEVMTKTMIAAGVRALSFSPDSKFVIAVGNDFASVFRVRGGKLLFDFPVSTQRRSGAKMIFSPDGKFMTLFDPGASGDFTIYATPES